LLQEQLLALANHHTGSCVPGVSRWRKDKSSD